MTETLYKGKISFVNYEKYFATIEYVQNSKVKSVNFKTNAADSDKKAHHYRLGDVVNFQMKLSDRGDKMTAFKVKFLHNTAIDLLIQKATIENRFSGYLKKVEEEYFVKEWESYIFFPLQLSPWEKPPVATAENEAISFRFLNLEKPNAITAELFSHNFIPEYKMAVQHFKNQIIADAVVTKVSQYAVYLGLFNNKIQAKLPLKKGEVTTMKEGDLLQVRISYLSNNRITVEPVASN
ncbi:MAG: hypothetical protein WBC06_14605 [Chitinophagaceae bacterium]